MTGLRSTDVDNGRREWVETLPYAGFAGVVADEKGGEYAAFGRPRTRAVGTYGTVGARRVVIETVAASKITAAMFVVTFTYVDGAA